MNLALIGCGTIGKVHAACASQAGLTLAVCADTVLAKAEALARQYGAKAVKEPAAACTRDDVDVVAVATPTPAHTEYVVAAARNGKHVFCEKPLARTIEQCHEAMDACRDAGVKLFVGHVVRYFHEFEAIRRQIELGKVGNVGFVRTYRGGVFPHGEKNWFADFEQSGGVTLDCIIHDFDWLRYMFGDPVRIFCQDLRSKLEDGIDYALVTTRFKSGIIASTTGSWAHPSGFRVKVEVCGDTGMIQFDSAETPITFMLRGTEPGAPGVVVPGSPVMESPYLREWRDFVSWLGNRAEPRVTPEDAVWAVRMALAALESARAGQPATFAG
jgi:predicted dehydrogenase